MSTAPTPAHRGRAPGRLKLTLAALAVLLLAAILGMLVVDRIFFKSSSSPAGTGSGVAATQARSLSSFTGVDLAGDRGRRLLELTLIRKPLGHRNRNAVCSKNNSRAIADI